MHDGLGLRRLVADEHDGETVEILDVAPALAQHPAFEAAVRARAARLRDIVVTGTADIRRIDRNDRGLRVVADYVDGVRLPELLAQLTREHIVLTRPASMELCARIVRAAAMLHEKPGLTHGAITPAHSVVTREGAVLTDSVFGGALEALQRNREQLWREFQIAMPSSASLPRFDTRADVTQLGIVVLTIVLGRMLAAEEYPRPISDIINAATTEVHPTATVSTASRLRMWLYQAMQLHPRENFANACEADRAFQEIMGSAGSRRSGIVGLRSALARARGEAEEAPAPAIVVAPPAPVVDAAEAPVEAAPRRNSLFRAVFSNFRAN